MNKLCYLILLCSVVGSCYPEYEKKSSFHSHIEPAKIQLNTNEIHFGHKIHVVDELIPSSIYFSAVFDYYNCVVESRSSPLVNILYEDQHMYISSQHYRLMNCHFLEYTDIDDLEVSIEKPRFALGTHKNDVVIKIPIKSPIDCIHRMNIILNYSNELKEKAEVK